jgi:hypothetical protein
MHAHVQRLVSVVKIATVLEEYTNKEQSSVVRFCGQQDSMQRMFTKKCFLFMVASVCHVHKFITGSRNCLKDVQKAQMMPDVATALGCSHTA